ncbi:YaiO family outer membrane beta-barrel protein [Pseudarcicella hirudinis]|uniref:YaiO family outer membrane beta-barrel protein n=1 Tax=Pseudarcicella hirudinis TaxID=1079859 RepID=UPI0035EFB8B7
MTLSYDYLYFDQNYNSALHNSPWNIASLSYSTRTGIGSVIGRVSYANRFSSNGLQAEIDAYPRISNVFYSYLNVGYSDDLPVFPKFRAGMSLYANLPKSFEGEVGFRYLKFSSETWIYTASLGKYIGNYWFNLRTFLVPGNTNLSQSYTLTTRYYYGEADDYISVGIGTGISPDESRSVLIERQLKLNSKKVNLGLSKIFNKRNVFIITASWFNEEQHNSPNGNQFDVGLSYQRRF